MAFVPDFDHDIFISYAHVDDEPFAGGEPGWVTTLISYLTKRLNQLIGREHRIWMDDELSRTVDITPEIYGLLERSATLLVILSPGYVNSDWCEQERREFLRIAGERRQKGQSIFLVERDVVDERPAEFGEVLGYQFWAYRGKQPRILGVPLPRPDDNLYFEKVDDLARDVARELKRLRHDASNGKQIKVVEDPIVTDLNGSRKAIYLAEVTDSLDATRDEIKRYLDQYGFHVLPNKWYPRDADAFCEAVDRDLERCYLFAQLLNDVTGKRPPDSSRSYVELQYERAVEAGKPIVQWRSSTLDLSRVTHDAYRKVLESVTVLTVDMEEFKRELLNRLQTPAAVEEHSPARDAFVFVDFDKEDEAEADRLCELLESRGVTYARTLHAGEPKDIRKDLMANFRDCDGLIMIYGKNPPVWVRERLRLWLKAKRRRQKRPRALAVYETAPHPEAPISFKLPEMQVIDGCDGFDEQRLAPFLQAIVA